MRHHFRHPQAMFLIRADCSTFFEKFQKHPQEGATARKPSEKYETANFTYLPKFHKNLNKIRNSITVVGNIFWYRSFPVKQMTLELHGSR
jgi:hypothetical protein